MQIKRRKSVRQIPRGRARVRTEVRQLAEGAKTATRIRVRQTNKAAG